VHPDQILRSLRRPWVVIATVTLLGVIASMVTVLVTVPQYRATAKLFVSAESATTLPDLSGTDRLSGQVAQSYADVASTHYVLDAVISELRLPMTAGALAAVITADVPADTVVIEVNASDASGSRAAQIANAIAARLLTASSALSPTRSGDAPRTHLTLIQQAGVPGNPVKPEALVDLLLGLLAGLGTGILAAGLLERRA
jgi:succinoglycan biosynthesis transport protein ExoP